MITFYSSGLAQVASGWVGNVGSSRFNSKKGKRAKTKMLTIKKKKKKKFSFKIYYRKSIDSDSQVL